MWDITNIEMDEYGNELLLMFPQEISLSIDTVDLTQSGTFLCRLGKQEKPSVKMLPPKDWGTGIRKWRGYLYTAAIHQQATRPTKSSLEVSEGRNSIILSNELDNGDVYNLLELSAQEWLPVRKFLFWLQEQTVQEYQDELYLLQEQILSMSPLARIVMLPPTLSDMTTLLLGQRQTIVSSA